VPRVFKFWSVNPWNIGLSPVCNPVSTSVFTPFIVARTVPCDGEENAEPLTTVSASNFVFTFESKLVIVFAFTWDEPLITVSASNLFFTPSLKWSEPLSNDKLLFVSILPPPLKPLPLPIVILEWSMCSFATYPSVLWISICDEPLTTVSASNFAFTFESKFVIESAFTWEEPLITPLLSN
jgi:hypothetical protein